ncbi:tail fiber domain-containing protein [Flavobacteriaceae bacterium]|nr:tail fiber domain-containing protein [Flavobacteriaceae bacterium]
MKNIFTLLALTIGFSMNAQFWYQGTGSGAIQTYYATASGNYSTAMGHYIQASGYSSTAMGRYTDASGDYSTAMGQSTTASGYASTAMGYATTASGNYSTAMGAFTTASDYGSLVIGQHNSSGSSVTNSATVFNSANTAFVIGNGTGTGVDASDAFKVLFNGDTTAAGSVTATAFIGDGSQLTGLPTGGGSPFSLNATSNGIQSNNNTASGNYSTAMGENTTASGDNSTAMGTNTTASWYFSTAMGFDTEASGNTSTAMGKSTIASGNSSTAMGNGTTASGDNSTAMGYETTASDFGSLVIGQYNSSGSSETSAFSDRFFSTANTAFVIGNGADTDNKADAFKVMFNGDATVGNDLTVEGDVVINSDMRLKANILSLGSTLYKLLQIDGKTYTMKRDATKKQKIGLLAQDIEKVFPELVVENKGVKSVNYQGLVPVLINALKEQDGKMKEQEKRLERLEAIISNMDK